MDVRWFTHSSKSALVTCQHTHTPIKNPISSHINPTLDFLPLIYLICYMIMFHHGLYAPHLSPFSNFHAEFLPNPMVKDHSFTLPLHYGTTYHGKGICHARDTILAKIPKLSQLIPWHVLNSSKKSFAIQVWFIIISLYFLFSALKLVS